VALVALHVGSHTAVQQQLGRGGWWRYIRSALRALCPDVPVLPEKAPRRQDFEYMREHYLATDEAIARSLELHTEVATAPAKQAGNLDPDAARSTIPR